MRSLSILIALFLLTACGSMQRPFISLAQGEFEEGPMIVDRGGRYYLRYRRAIEADLIAVLYSKKTSDAGYYFFGPLVSSAEWGNLIERPLAFDGLEEHARAGRVYWLDPDGTTHPIPVRAEGGAGRGASRFDE